ncbi:MAG TPA: hypothetical protein VGS20_05945 [Candidatus Acidoferrales bacterium]|nr:hypothetical protein [Candidatus Acidoferrales bacterium]
MATLVKVPIRDTQKAQLLKEHVERQRLELLLANWDAIMENLGATILNPRSWTRGLISEVLARPYGLTGETFLRWRAWKPADSC